MSGELTYTEHVDARLGDYFGPGVQWQRRLWRVGSVLAVREIIEASRAVTAGALSDASLDWLVKQTRTALRADPGLGDKQAQASVLKTLSADISDGSVAHRQLELIADQLEEHYLDRLMSAAASQTPPSPETLTVAIATHLLDRGIGTERLRSWHTSLRAGGGQAASVTDTIEAAQQLLTTSLLTFSVLLLVEEGPKTKAQRPPEWCNRGEAARWLQQQGFVARPRQQGGFMLEIEAWDAADAASRAHDLADRLGARAAVGTRTGLTFVPELYIAGPAGTTVHPLRRQRRAEVRALEREDKLFELSGGSAVDSALELLAQMNTGPSPAAVAGGWSAVESLLTAPGDRGNVVAADRLAALVTCSWPRAELTTLAWAREKQKSGPGLMLANDLRGLATNREKAARFLRALTNGEEIGLSRRAERAAVVRMRALLDDPVKTLEAVQRYGAECLRRLYRQRNLVLHGGQTEAVAMEATLRTSAPLVGAGLDRIAHSFLVHDRHPLDTAARAEFRLQTLAGPIDISVLALFDDP